MDFLHSVLLLFLNFSVLFSFSFSVGCLFSQLFFHFPFIRLKLCAHRTLKIPLTGVETFVSVVAVSHIIKHFRIVIRALNSVLFHRIVFMHIQVGWTAVTFNSFCQRRFIDWNEWKPNLLADELILVKELMINVKAFIFT